jgi:hypothetical protein
MQVKEKKPTCKNVFSYLEELGPACCWLCWLAADVRERKGRKDVFFFDFVCLKKVHGGIMFNVLYVKEDYFFCSSLKPPPSYIRYEEIVQHKRRTKGGRIVDGSRQSGEGGGWLAWRTLILYFLQSFSHKIHSHIR